MVAAMLCFYKYPIPEIYLKSKVKYIPTFAHSTPTHAHIIVIMRRENIESTFLLLAP